jgi:hypothetical protein
VKRWTTIFAVNGTISTSDIRNKKNIRGIQDQPALIKSLEKRISEISSENADIKQR